MLTFEPRDPFPLLVEGDHTYLEAQVHAAAVDRWLGLGTDAIEKCLAMDGCRAKAPTSHRESKNREVQELWLGLATQSLLTPYTEIRSLLAKLKPTPGQKIVDLGAAYGRMAFVIERYYPGVEFIGYEYVGERVREGRRCFQAHGLKNSRLEHLDLTAIDLSLESDSADIYFIYDYGTSKAIEKTLYDLRKIAAKRPINLIGRGRRCRYSIESKHPWLKKTDPSASEGRTTLYVSNAPELQIEAMV